MIEWIIFSVLFIAFGVAIFLGNKHIYKKKPTIINKSEPDITPESYTVTTWCSRLRGSRGYYDDFIFTKRDNGKYRLKLSVFQRIMWALGFLLILGCIAGNIWFWNTFLPKASTQDYIYVCLLWTELTLFMLYMFGMHSGTLRAIVSFHKYMKTQKVL